MVHIGLQILSIQLLPNKNSIYFSDNWFPVSKVKDSLQICCEKTKKQNFLF